MARYNPITVARFWSKVDVKRSGVDCWNWTGAKRGGYGHIKIDGSSYGSNRVAFEIVNEEVLGDRMALHKCDNKLCCNPKHIYAGTASENMSDMHQRIGRSIDKLKPCDVHKIRDRLELGERHRDIASDFGVNKAIISKIKTGKAWAHV